MSQRVKLGLYVVFTIGACLFGFFAFSSYSRLMTDSSSKEPASSEVPAVGAAKAGSPASAGFARMMTFGVGFFVMVVGLGLLLGNDVSHFIGNRALKVLYNDEGVGMTDPEYDQAEQEWADGHHLEAIRLMREYLKRNPREQHVAIRIAEIYEKDLQNHLAAALEYEEVLKHKLPRERWGWAGIHLCNLYFKLNQPDKAVALLRRIDAEYSETAAAEKARKRLVLYDGEADQSSAIVEEGNPLPPGFQSKQSS